MYQGTEPAVRISFTDRSTTVTTVSTQIMAQNLNRNFLFVQNPDGGVDLWINFGSAATINSPSVRLAPGEIFIMEGSVICTDQINGISTKSSHTVTAKEA